MTHKKILIFTGAFSSGGAEKQSILLAKALKDEGYEITIISYFGEKQLRRYIVFMDDENINYTNLVGKVLEKIKKFKTIVKTVKPDVIINYLPSNNIIGGLIGRLYKTKMIIGNVRNSRLGALRYLELLISNNLFDHHTVFNNTSGLNHYLKRGFNKRKSLFIPNVLYPLPELLNRSERNQQVEILMVSRFEKQKDYPTAIQVFTKLTKNNSNIAIKLIGIGSLENEVIELIKINKLDKHVEIIRNPEDIFSHYKKADLFLQTSLFEGISNSILEAMSYSLPIVATNVGDNSGLVKHNENGFLTNTGDVDQIASFLQKLIDNPDLRNKMGKASHDLVRSEFSIEKFKSNYIQLINEAG